MNLLLDTHVLFWWLGDPSLLSKEAKRRITDGKNTVHISAAVVWEIVIKKSLGRLDSPDNLDEVLEANHFLPLPITIHHALAVQSLPGHHRDPFDRMLVAQAIHEGMTLVTRDPNIQKYAVSCLVA